MTHIDRRRFLLAASAWLASTACKSTGASPSSEASAYFAAIESGDLRAVQAELDAAPVLLHAVDTEGRSGFAVAWLGGHGSIAAFLRDRGYLPDPIERCLAGELEGVVEEFAPMGIGAKEGVLGNRLHPAGGNALWAAARTGRPNLWRLTSLGLDPDVAGRDGGAAAAALSCEDDLAAWLTVIDLLGNGAAPVPSLLESALERGDARIVQTLVRKHTPRSLDHERDLLRRHTPANRARLEAALEGVTLDCRSSRFAYDASGAPWVEPDLSGLDPALVQKAVGFSHFNFEGLRNVVGDEALYSSARSYADEVSVEACAHTGQREIVQFHLDRGAPLSLPTAFTLGDIGRAKALLTEDPQRVHERGAHDFAVMWYPLIGKCGVEGVELLLAHGAPVDQESYGTTALHWAAMGDDAEAAALLLERGANLDAVGYKFGRVRETPLDVAIRRESESVRALLVERGARRG